MHSDHQYIEALRRGDSAGIDAIYKQFSTQARRWVEQNNGTAADAKDVFQEAVLAVYEKALDPDFILTCPLGALLHLIYSRKWIDRLRQKGKEMTVRKEEELRYTSESTEDAMALAEDAMAQQVRQERLASTFQMLSDLCRQMLTLLKNGISPREAAEKLQLNSVDTLYRRKNACMQRWRALFLEL